MLSKFNIISMNESFNEHPLGKIGVIIYFTGCSKACSGNPCINNGIPCHNPDLFNKKDSDYKTWDELKSEFDTYFNDELLNIDSVIFCGGEPCDSIEELNSLSKLIHDNYPNVEQVLFTHYTDLPKSVDTKYITWIKHGEWGKYQWYVNLKTKEQKVLYNAN